MPFHRSQSHTLFTFDFDNLNGPKLFGRKKKRLLWPPTEAPSTPDISMDHNQTADSRWIFWHKKIMLNYHGYKRVQIVLYLGEGGARGISWHLLLHISFNFTSVVSAGETKGQVHSPKVSIHSYAHDIVIETFLSVPFLRCCCAPSHSSAATVKYLALLISSVAFLI